MTAIMGERGMDAGSGFMAVAGAIWAVVWGGTGIGLLRRWEGAWVISLSIVSGSLLLIALGARGNPLGAICNGMLCAGILCVLIARKGEFR
jgi:hypothetical protein